MDDETQDGSTQESVISNLSLLDNETDEFYQRSVEAVRRDQQRLQNAASDSALPTFSRTRPRAQNAPVALTLENLERNSARPATAATNTKQSEAVTRVRGSESEPSSTSDISISPNIPAQWGRKGRQKNAFLRRISSSGANDQERQEQGLADPDRLFRRRTLYTGDSPELDHETGEPSPGFRRRSVNFSRSGKPLLDDIVDQEAIGRNAKAKRTQSMNFVSPSRGAARNSVPEREISDVNAMRVTTHRLAEAASREHLRKPLSLSAAFLQTESNDADPVQENQREAGSRRRRGSSPEKLKSAASVRLFENDAQAQNQSSRPALHKRSSSRELLRQLARASSSTPSPSRTREPVRPERRPLTPELHARRSVFEPPQEPSLKASPPSPTSRVPTRPSSSLSFSRSPAKSSLQSKTSLEEINEPDEDFKALPKRDTSLPQRRSRPLPANTGPVLKESAIATTPLVTGGWVETPNEKQRTSHKQELPTEERTSHEGEAPSGQRTSRDGKLPTGQRSVPSVINLDTQAKNKKSSLRSLMDRLPGADSAQSSTLEGPTAAEQSGQVNEHTTFVSLADLCALTGDIDDETLDLVANISTPVSKRRARSATRDGIEGLPGESARARRVEEEAALARLARSLKTVRLGSRGAARRLKVSDREGGKSQRARAASDTTKTDSSSHADLLQQQLQQSHRITIFTVLRGTLLSLKPYIITPHSTFAINQTKPRSRWRPRWPFRLTPLGLMLSIFLAWHLVESTMCIFYCHLFVACRWRDSTPSIWTPRRPWVTWTIAVERPFGYAWGYITGQEYHPKPFPSWQHGPWPGFDLGIDWGGLLFEDRGERWASTGNGKMPRYFF